MNFIIVNGMAIVAGLLISTHANAGFITGYMIGSSVNGSNKSSSTSNSNAIYSDSHDVITCCRENKSDVS